MRQSDSRIGSGEIEIHKGRKKPVGEPKYLGLRSLRARAISDESIEELQVSVSDGGHGLHRQTKEPLFELVNSSATNRVTATPARPRPPTQLRTGLYGLSA